LNAAKPSVWRWHTQTRKKDKREPENRSTLLLSLDEYPIGFESFKSSLTIFETFKKPE